MVHSALRFAPVVCLSVLGVLCLVPVSAAESWVHRALPAADKGQGGINSDKVYADWPLRSDAEPVVVAVIDSGMDIAHEDLKRVLWHNPGERDGQAGVDDDGNGYIDDLHGWNFIGKADGSANLTDATRIVTRELRRLRAAKQSGELSEADRKLLEQVEDRYAKGLAQAQQGWSRIAAQQEFFKSSLLRMAALGADPTSLDSIKQLDLSEPFDLARRAMVVRVWPQRDRLEAMVEQASGPLTHWFNLDFDDSSMIGDDPSELDERHYGNHALSVRGTDYHGTHVAGIIAADRTNGKGIKGICAGARIMVLRAVPDGDERDKDIANAIRYAADNGAKVINMSFGKEYSPHKEIVDAAARYALERDVLLIGAAGNDGLDIDKRPHYPMPTLQEPIEGEAAMLPNWLLVGASGPKLDQGLPASFSNYGRTTVHLFAPGVDILSCAPGGRYEKSSGTSMASPVVAGVAALVRWQYPELSAVQVAEILVSSSRALDKLQVRVPGSKKKAAFGTLCVSGGVVDAWAALEAAQALAQAAESQP